MQLVVFRSLPSKRKDVESSKNGNLGKESRVRARVTLLHISVDAHGSKHLFGSDDCIESGKRSRAISRRT